VVSIWVNLVIHRLSTGYPQVIHRLSTVSRTQFSRWIGATSLSPSMCAETQMRGHLRFVWGSTCVPNHASVFRGSRRKTGPNGKQPVQARSTFGPPRTGETDGPSTKSDALLKGSKLQFTP
jgi:hypothetical protein